MAKVAFRWSAEEIEASLRELASNVIALYPEWPAHQLADEALKMADPEFLEAFSRGLLLKAFAKAIRVQRRVTANRPSGGRYAADGELPPNGAGEGNQWMHGEQGLLFPDLEHLPYSIKPDSTLGDVREEIAHIKRKQREHIRRLEGQVEAAKREKPAELVDLEKLEERMAPYARRYRGITVREVAERMAL